MVRDKNCHIINHTNMINIIAHRIKRFLHDGERFFGYVDWFINKFNVEGLLKEAGCGKSRGYAPLVIFKYLLSLPFFNVTYHTDMKENITSVKFKKDVVRNFLNNKKADWIQLTTMLAYRVLKYLRPDFLKSEEPFFFIIDDTDYERSHAHYVDELSWQWNHNKNKSYKGFKLDALSIYFDNIILPLSGIFVSSSKPEKILYSTKEVMLPTPGFTRRELARGTATKAFNYQLETARKDGFPKGHILFDSWYTHPKTLLGLIESGYEVSGMLKANGTTKFLYQDKWLNVREIFDLNRSLFPRPNKDNIFFSTIVRARSQEKTFSLKLVYAGNVHEKKDYICIASTNTLMPAKTIVECYTYRFTLEFIFKSLKNPTLRLLNENQSLSLDGISAHLAVVLCRYILILTEKETSEQPTKSIFAQAQKLAREEHAVIEMNTSLDLIRVTLDAISKEKNIPLEELEEIAVNTLAQSETLQKLWNDLPECSKSNI